MLKNPLLERIMLHGSRPAFCPLGYLNGLLSAGRTVFVADEAQQALGVKS